MATAFSTSPVFAVKRAPDGRSWATAYLSSEALGTTNADVVDCGGLTFAGIYISTRANAACGYRVDGGLESTDVRQ